MKLTKILTAMALAAVATFTFAACKEESSECNHEYSDISVINATCETDGVLAHEKCSKCNAVFVNGVETTEDALVIPALGHDLHAAGDDQSNYFDAAKHFAKNVKCEREGCAHTETFEAIHIGSADELMQYATDLNALKLYSNIGCNAMELTADIDLSGKTWTPIMLNHYDGTLSINGNGHTISNLTTAANVSRSVGFIGYIEWSAGVEFSNITFENATISADLDGEDGVSVFVGYADGFETLKFTNCKVLNCNVSGGNWTGAFYGSLSATDSSANPKVTIKNCAVEGSAIHGNGASGSAIGHSTGSASTSVLLENCSFKNNEIICQEEGRHNKAGQIIGSIGVGSVTVSNCTVESVTATSDGVSADRIYGRIVGGTFTVDGASITQDYSNDGTAVA